MTDQTGANNPNWKGGRVVEPRGYVLVRVGKDHPLADVRGYAYEHRLKAYEAGQLDPDGQPVHVHHRDETTGNNGGNNLEVLTPAQHAARHRTSGRALRDPGEPNPVVSCACGCGAMFARYDGEGRPRRYQPSHNPPLSSPTQDAVLAALRAASEPLSPSQLSSAIDRPPSVVKTALWKMKVRGAVNHAGRARWEAARNG